MKTIPRATSAFPELRCEIHASKRLAPILSNIVQTCARDLGQPVAVVLTARANATIPVITLVLPAEVVIEPHQAWCLACRVACFCPDARVSVLVTGATETAAAETNEPAADAA
ncbi:MAG: hypothetical protein IAE82_00745 [Opitutaceae bacterium]|nr:hypothetical protein [Opitutaceae bacterium]